MNNEPNSDKTRFFSIANLKFIVKSIFSLKFIVVLAVLFGVPFIINVLLIDGFPFVEDLSTYFPKLSFYLVNNGPTKDAWLGFWSNSFGTVLACIPAYLALEHSRKESKEQNFQTLESRRCSVMPVVDVSVYWLHRYPDTSDISGTWTFFTDIGGTNYAFSPDVLSSVFSEAMYDHNPERYFVFEVRNIGLGPAINAIVTNGKSLYYKGEVPQNFTLTSIMMILPPTPPENSKNFDLTIQYEDVFSNRYERKLSFTWDCSGSITDFVSTSPELVERTMPPAQ